MNRKTRKRNINLVIGGQGRGKSTFMKKLAIQILKKSTTEKIVIYDTLGDKTFDPLPVLSKLPSIKKLNRITRLSSYTIPYKDVTAFISRLGGCTFFFPDASSTENGRMTPELRKFIYTVRHCHIDVYMGFHSNRRIPIELWEQFDFVVKFTEGVLLDDRIKHLACFPEMAKFWEDFEREQKGAVGNNYYRCVIFDRHRSVLS